MIIKAGDCKDFIGKVLKVFKIPEEIVCRWAELLTETSLLGFDSHGIRMLERYINHIEGGGIEPSVKPEIVVENQQCMTMDAKGGLGHISADIATSIAIEKAKKGGISCIAVKNANHVGACGLYVRTAAMNDCVGIFTTISRAAMAPWGGMIPFLGSNPIAFGAPIMENPPFLFDAASSVVSMGKITVAKDNNKKIPDSWALDRQGKTTTNPSEAIRGSLLPMAGHKGYGLAMAVEILSAFLSGSLPSFQVESWLQQTEKPCNASFSIIVINIASLGDVDTFKKHMKIWVDLLTGSDVREGFKKIYYPGQIEEENYQSRLKSGIPLCACDYEMFNRLSGKFNIAKPEISGCDD